MFNCRFNALTGQGSLEAAIRAINEGEIYRFLTKPCNVMDLSNTIRQALQLKKLTRESSRLLIAAREQRSLLSGLENEYPRIAKVKRSRQGEIILEETTDDLDTLIYEINKEIRLFEGKARVLQGDQ
jgi:two-component system, probable response regulator PhcQ